MKIRHLLMLATIWFVLSSICRAQSNPKPENATAAVVGAFETHDIIMFGEIHGNKQEYEWLRSLVATREFAARVDDIVVETDNSLYQKSVDRYVSGEDVPLEQVQKAWRNVVGVIGPPSPVYASLYQAVRETNLKRRGKHQMRIVCGDSYIDWENVKDREDIAPYLGNRDQWYTQVVSLDVGWVGDLPAIPVISGGSIAFGPIATSPGPSASASSPPPLKLKDVAAAMLYLGSRDSLIQVSVTRAELDGTSYGKEVERRLTIEGFPVTVISENKEAPQFPRPQPASAGLPPLPPPPKNMGAPLPPRPPSQ